MKPCFVLIQEDIQFLISHIVENFSDALESLKYTHSKFKIHTFQELKTKYEQEKDQQNKKPNRYGPVSV